MLQSLFTRKMELATPTVVAQTQPCAQQLEQGISNSELFNAISEAQATIVFTKEGEIVDANKNFLSATGYKLSEIKGRHHRIFVSREYASSNEYKQFWEELRAGKVNNGEFQRFDVNGNEIWISASYCPVYDDHGQVSHVVKIALDITRQKQTQLEIQNRTQAVIEFTPDGTILNANQLFLDTVGYTLQEIRGKHHRMFMPEKEASEHDYANFWRSLGNGQYFQGEFRRKSKSGKEIWLQGAYNPVFDREGRVVKVVKNVTDITTEVAAKNKAGEIGTMIARSVSEMSIAIREISERISSTAEKAAESERDATRAGDSVKHLLDSSSAIDRVVSLIQDLAEQTNLLALNATIEAARAGEAGRGFAVVAAEVKALANETGRATQDIASSVSSIQDNIHSVVEAIGNIGRSAAEVNTNTTSIAASVEEQSLLMESLSSNSAELLELTER